MAEKTTSIEKCVVNTEGEEIQLFLSIVYNLNYPFISF